MAKKDNEYQEFEPEIFTDEPSAIVNVSKTEIDRFGQYINPFDVPEFREAMPEHIAGEALIGHLISIKAYEIRDSYAHKTEFILAEIEIAGLEGLYRASFFSIPCKTFFKAIENAKIPVPFVVGVVRQKATYGFQDAKEFLKANNR